MIPISEDVMPRMRCLALAAKAIGLSSIGKLLASGFDAFAPFLSSFPPKRNYHLMPCTYFSLHLVRESNLFLSSLAIPSLSIPVRSIVPLLDRFPTFGVLAFLMSLRIANAMHLFLDAPISRHPSFEELLVGEWVCVVWGFRDGGW